MNEQPGTMRFVLDPTHERIGIVLGPSMAIDDDSGQPAQRVALDVATGGVMYVQAIQDDYPREFVTWWLPKAKRWSHPSVEYQISLDTVRWQDYMRRSGPLRTPTVRQIPDMIDRIRRDHGIVIGGDDASTWYGVGADLGITR